ncbi:hypothetical protein ACL58G_01450 [Massilia sp. GER05]|uniref:hypothetical protein n=1 Tax=Massilia sp. GER05 TaxID=3394605 RepID=UPI003F84E568
MAQRSLIELAEESTQILFDVGVFAFGADLRSAYVLTQLRRTISDVLAVKSDEAETSRIESFEKRYSAKVLDVDDVCHAIREKTKNFSNKNFVPRVFVDVSSLSRVNLAKVFACLKVICVEHTVHLSIGYSLARYVRPPDQPFPSIRRLAPVHREFSGWGALPSLPVDVIVSLGYEKGKAIGAVEYLEPRNRWVFVPNSPEHRFLHQVKNHNKQLINAGESVIDYEVLEPVDTYYRLMSLVVGLSPSARPILLPFGPKLFFAIALLVSMRFEKAAVWYVDSDDDSIGLTSSPSGHGVIFSCRLVDRSD